jgi:hypothetical protein
MGGVGKLSSPGKIKASFFFNSQSFLRAFASRFEILDLSHPEILISSVAMMVPGAVCLRSLVRGGIQASVGGK